jgi:6-phosphofructokinase 1
MTKLKGACVLGQSGGPTSVINASAAGVFMEAIAQNEYITNVFGAKHGIRGILDEELYDMKKEDLEELKLLKTTPSSDIGSVRYKLKDASVDDTDYKRILEVFQKYDIRYFFYNGGNDSMDTCNKISKYLAKSGYECRCIGVPKTIDNDLAVTDHCPGYGSAAKYVATTLMEIKHDASVYDAPMVCVCEIMGRNAGWLTASSQLATEAGFGPDLVYLPELPFDFEEFMNSVEAKIKEKNHVLIAVSEGIQTKEGKYIPELFKELATDSFGHAQLGGTAQVLADQIHNKFGVKVRAIEFNLMQRCAQHLASRQDVNEAFNAGKYAVKFAIKGITDKMVGFKRSYDKNGKYKCNYVLIDLHLVANDEKKIPISWIKKDHTGLTKEFVDYALPLIQGDMKAPLENGLPRFAHLKKVLYK